MDCELPTEFDLIVVGTGIVESVVSAAASRIGKRVLHIDSNSYYGGHWASFNLDTILKINDVDLSNKKGDSELVPSEGEQFLKIGNNRFDLDDFFYEWHIPEKLNEDEAELKNVETENSELDEKQNSELSEKENHESTLPITQQQILKDSRKYNIDLTPKLQFARGEFVELLISSNIARYSEYRSVSRVLTFLNGRLEAVPCSRSDVFANNKVSVIEKRMLMKVLTSIDEEANELKASETKTFKEFLKDKKLTPNLIHYVLYALSMSDDKTSCSEGLQRTKRFLSSLGRFGKTPFLFSMYGSGEITQAFCRLSAVFGGIFALNQPLTNLVLSGTEKFQSIICGKQKISAQNIVMGIEKSPETLLKNVHLKSKISRGVFITDKSILEIEKEHLTLLLFPPENSKNSCVILEMGTLTGTCPKDFYLVHITTKQETTPKDDVQHCVQSLFNQGTENDLRPNVLWSCYFSLPNTNESDLKTGIPENVHLCPGPDFDLDYDFTIQKAKSIFEELYPDLEFLPRAPDPDEIIIGDDENNETIEPNEINENINTSNELEEQYCDDSKEHVVENDIRE